MIKKLNNFILFFVTLILPVKYVNAVATGLDIVIAPSVQTHFLEITESENLFDVCPVYELNNPRQILQHNGWEGELDYGAQVRLFWSSDAIYLKFVIKDDKVISGKPEAKDNNKGDYIQIILAHLTCGPDRIERQPWSITLFPNLESEICTHSISTGSKKVRAKLGKNVSVMNRSIDGYTVITKIPYEKWDDLPRIGGMTRLQVIFGDTDMEGLSDHKFVLFPVSPELKDLENQTSNFGNIRYADKTWVTVYPKDVVFHDHVAKLLLEIGNLTDRSVEVEIYPEEKDSTPIYDAKDKAHQFTYEIPANTVKQNVEFEYSFENLATGGYRINAKAGVFYDAGTLHVKYSEKSGLIYCPDLIDRRKKVKPRNLEIYKDPTLVQKTFSYLAGGGRVLWSVGKYDATSNEFPQYIRRKKSYEITLPGEGATNIPWALLVASIV